MKANISLKYPFLSLLMLLLGFLSQCKNSFTESDYFTPKILAVADNGNKYVSSNTCFECHAEIYEAYLKTAHFNTSAHADPENIKAGSKDGSNSFELEDATISLFSNNKEYFQKSTFKFGTVKENLSKIDIKIGSGVKGQSYLNWENNSLYQLQASYYTPTDGWINGPGFPNSSYKRPVNDACLKCHVTYAKNLDQLGIGNQYDKDALIIGIDCQKCHGPLENHVIYQRTQPNETNLKSVIKIDSLPRNKRLDICAQCHSGLRNIQIKGNAFSFMPGDDLNDYSKNFGSLNSQEKLDVHGNQVGLLSRSQCFKKTPQMDCMTCHDPHKLQRGNLLHFNKVCIGCHKSIDNNCKNEMVANSKMPTNDCVACHMPLIPSSTMQIQLKSGGATEPVYIRSHLIEVLK